MSLLEIFQVDNAIEIVDIGANPIDGEPPYKELLATGKARLTGFEPQPDALEKLEISKGVYERYFPYVIGDGNVHTLHIYQGSGLASLLKLDEDSLNIFAHLKPLAGLISELPLQIIRLDDVEEIELIDYLKIDIQGGELAVFQNAKILLKEAICIQTEVSFVPIYEGQPTIGDVDCELRAQGFIPHCFAMPVNTGPISPIILNNQPWQGLRQLGEADIVYVKDFRKLDEFSDLMLKKLTMVAHFCYQSFDLAGCLLQELSRRGSIEKDSLGTYISSVNRASSPD